MAQVAAFGRPASLFVITGGDPFQRPDLAELVRRGTGLGLPVSVSPSGTPTLTRAALVGLREAGARAISLSVDAATPAGHDGFRGGATACYGLSVRRINKITSNNQCPWSNHTGAQRTPLWLLASLDLGRRWRPDAAPFLRPAARWPLPDRDRAARAWTVGNLAERRRVNRVDRR